jgi:hypothetical protein
MTVPALTNAWAFLRNAAGVAIAAKGCTLTVNGVGDYTLNLNQAADSLETAITVTPETAGRMVAIVHTSDTAKQILTYDDAGVAADADFTALVERILGSATGGY